MARYKVGDKVYVGRLSEPTEITFVSTCVSPMGEESIAYLVHNMARFVGEEELHDDYDSKFETRGCASFDMWGCVHFCGDMDLAQDK